MDQFPKIVHFLAKPNIKAQELAKLFVKEIHWLQDLPENIASVHNSRFTRQFEHSILRILVIKEKLSTVFHLKIDGPIKSQTDLRIVS